MCVSYRQRLTESGRIQDLVTASLTVKGMDRVNRRSDKARLKMKMWRAVLISLRHTAAIMTHRLPGTVISHLLNFIKFTTLYRIDFPI